MIVEIITNSLAKVTGVDPQQIGVVFAENEDHGEYATNVALVTAKQEEKSPKDLAEEIIQKLTEDSILMQYIERIEVAGPGFINFYLKDEYLVAEIKQILEGGDDYGKLTIENRKILLEFGQPNTHKAPHIGHLYSYILGESLARLLEAVGNKVIRANYQGDVGLHVAKCLWALQKNKPEIPDTLEERIQLLQRMYQIGSQAFDEDESAKAQIVDLNKKIYSHDQEIEKLWEQTRSWNVEYYKLFEQRLGMKYDRYYFESEVYSKGIDIVKDNTGKIFKESQGAVIFEGSKHGLHDRVFLTQYETPTYEAKDMALQEVKLEEFSPDLIIITTANEQNEYFRVVFKALETFNKKYIGKLKHIGFGMVNLKSGKMSSRTGNIIGAVELVNMTVDEVKKINSDTAEVVGLGAVKYSFLKNNHLQNIVFDFEESISVDGNSGPYLQYTFARTQSVITKSKKTKKAQEDQAKLNAEERKVARHLVQYFGVITMAAKNYSPSTLCTYLFNLAQAYNTFYNKHKIIGSQQEEFRLQLTDATGQIIKNGLYLLGIQAPDRM